MSNVSYEEKQQRIIDVGEVEQFDFVFVNTGSALKQITKDRFVALLKELIGSGNDGVGIANIEQTTTSTEDGGTNVVTITLTNNEKYTYQFRNGSKGSNGITPHIGENGNWFIGDEDTGVSATGGSGGSGAAQTLSLVNLGSGIVEIVLSAVTPTSGISQNGNILNIISGVTVSQIENTLTIT